MFLPMNNRLEERWSHELAPAAAGGGGVTERPMAGHGQAEGREGGGRGGR